MNYMDFMKKKLTYVLFWILFILSLLATIKYSDFQVIQLPLDIDRFFIKPPQSDEIVKDLAIGYIVSAFFYLILVYYPESVKKKKVTKLVIDELGSIYTEAIMLIVLMYKNVCLKSDWKFSCLKDDTKLFDEKFYERMAKFDGYKNADTLQCRIENDGSYKSLTWDDKLAKDFEDFTNRINQLINRYIFYIDDKIIDKTIAFANNTLIRTFLGLPSNSTISVYTGKNGIKYAERVAIFAFRNDPSGKRSPLFCKTDVVDNSNILRDYITTLVSLKEICSKSPNFKPDIAIEYFCRQDCGQYGIAIF